MFRRSFALALTCLALLLAAPASGVSDLVIDGGGHAASNGVRPWPSWAAPPICC